MTRTKTSARKPGARGREPGAASRESDLEGWQGWDDYAAFYDWENARTVGRRDVDFWRGVAVRIGGRALELGCGTGRVLVPLARAGVHIVGVDRSAPMLARGRARLRRLRTPVSAALVRGDVRDLPGAGGAFDLVVAPYGILQSLLRERDLTRTLESVARVLAPGGVFGIDLVPDVPNWREYSRRITMRGHRGPRRVPITLVESVRQDRARKLTFFDQEFTEGAAASAASRWRSAPSASRRCAAASSAPASRSTPSSAATTANPGTPAPTRGSCWRGNDSCYGFGSVAATASSRLRNRSTMAGSLSARL
jgi:ubiquinone/menaquinone biosynthesis C-methylase UbiE